MQVTINRTAEVVSGKEYPLTVTRQAGRQEIEVEGRTLEVEALTSFESPLGRSRCYTRASETAPAPGAREQRVREAAAQALAAQGIW